MSSAPGEALLKNQNIIVFGEDFGRHAHSLEHLLRPLFPYNQWIWVETIGIRSPKFSLYDLKRIFEKLTKWFKPQITHEGVEVPENITIVRPLMIPLNQYGIVRRLNRWSVKRAVEKVLHEHRMTSTVSIYSVPNAADYVGDFNESLKVYVCVDEFSLWPGLNYKMVKSMEDLLLKKSDMVFATSKSLQNTKSNGKSETLLLTHGVEFKHFNIGPKPAPSNSLQICYFGLFDERSDQRILKEMAVSLPEEQFHIYGNVVCSIDELEELKNVHFHGPVPYKKLPQVISAMDVFILPYVRNELTENINPLKLKEYLSTGRPVIATALPEVEVFKDYLYLGNNSQDFIAHIEAIKAGQKLDVQKTLAYLEANETWEAKARFFSSEILKRLP